MPDATAEAPRPVARHEPLTASDWGLLCAQVVVSEGSVGTLELQEAGVGGGFAPITALYSELVKVWHNLCYE